MCWGRVKRLISYLEVNSEYVIILFDKVVDVFSE